MRTKLDDIKDKLTRSVTQFTGDEDEAYAMVRTYQKALVEAAIISPKV